MHRWSKGVSDLRETARNRLVVLGCASIAWRTLQIIVQTVYGVTDYGDKGIMSEGRVFGPWTFFELLGRLNNLSMLFVPLLWSHFKHLGKVVLLAILAIHFILLISSGSRGAVIFPAVFILVGYYLFVQSRRRLDWLVIIAILCTVPFLILMDHFRNSESFKGTETSDFKGRILAFQNVEERAAEVSSVTEGNANLRVLGSAIVGVSDAVIYERTPELIPHAGWERIDSVVHTWIPSYFFREKYSLHDHNQILRQYLGEYEKNSLAISLSADCYRRFGWWGPPIGVALAWIVYGLWHRMIAHCLVQADPFLGGVIAIGSLTFLQMGTFSTLLGTWWVWAYDIPKNFGALVLLAYAVKILYQSKPQSSNAMSRRLTGSR